MTRGMGFRPDSLWDQWDDQWSRHAVSTIGRVGLLPMSASASSLRCDWRHLLDRVSDQKNSNSCVGQFVSNAVYLAGQAGHSLGRCAVVKRPSVLWSYAVARLRDLAAQGVPAAQRMAYLHDDGCQPRMMMLGCQENGLVAEERWPFDLASINAAIPFDLDIGAADATLTGWYGISAPGSPDVMRAALDAGHFPGFALEVHENFTDASGAETYSDVRGDLVGYHMITAIGHRPGAILILNSWSENWGDGGCLWISDDIIASPYVTHRMIVTAAPSGLA